MWVLETEYPREFVLERIAEGFHSRANNRHILHLSWRDVWTTGTLVAILRRQVLMKMAGGEIAHLEARLTALASDVAAALQFAGALTKSLQRLRAGAAAGHLIEIAKRLSSARDSCDAVRQAVSEAAQRWTFDPQAYLEQNYTAELLDEAKAQGVNLLERDKRLYCFPLALRLEPADLAVKIGKRREQRLRPKVLVEKLSKLQKQRPRFNAPRILDTIYRLYQRVHRDSWGKRESGPGPAMPVSEVHELLTLLPGNDYSIEEFGRDLLLLSREPDLRTRDGNSFEFLGSTWSKERIRRVNVYDEHGNEVIFLAVRFIKGA